MRLAPSRDDWGLVAKGLHWLIALIVIGQLALGLLMEQVADVGRQFELYQLHKSIGLTVLALVALRLTWRLTHTAPLPATGLKGWEKAIAVATHLTLYALLLLMPLSGWLLVSASTFQVETFWFGWLRVPHLAGPDAALSGAASLVHWALGWVMIVLILLHAAAALRHHFILKDNVLRRML